MRYNLEMADAGSSLGSDSPRKNPYGMAFDD